MFFRVLVLTLVICMAPAAGLLAQDKMNVYSRYQGQLLRMADILGALHHLRGSCIDGETQIWREEMMELIRLESPSPERKDELITRFNNAYAAARRDFAQCNRTTSKYAQKLADEGSHLTETALLSINP